MKRAPGSTQIIGVQMVTAADGSAFTGTVSCLITKDAGTQGASTNNPVHEGNGFHSLVVTDGESDAAHIGFTFTGTGAIPATIQVYTTFPQTGDSFARLGAPAGASVSADVAAVKALLPTALTANGNIKASLVEILSTALTETTGQIAAAFKKFFDKASPTGTVNSLPDAVAGANGGLPTTNGTKINQTVDLTAGQTIAATIAAGAIAADAVDAASIKADAVTKIQNGLATGAEIAALNDLDSTQVQAAADAALDAFGAATETNVTAVGNAVVGVGNAVAALNDVSPAEVNAACDAALADYAPAQAGDEMALTSGERTTLTAVIWNALTSGMSTVGSIGRKIADWILGTDNKNLISTDAQDLSTTLQVDSKPIVTAPITISAGGTYTYRARTFLGTASQINVTASGPVIINLFDCVGSFIINDTQAGGYTLKVNMYECKGDFLIEGSHAGALELYHNGLDGHAILDSNVSQIDIDGGRGILEINTGKTVTLLNINGFVGHLLNNGTITAQNNFGVLGSTFGADTAEKEVDALLSSNHGSGLWEDMIGKVFYVNGAIGSSGDGLSFATAKKTIAEAIALFSSGDRGIILIAGGSYSENFTVPMNVKLKPMNGIVYIKGVFVSDITPIITMLAGSSLENIWIVKDFNTPLAQLVKIGSKCKLKGVGGYVTGTGAIVSLFNLYGAPVDTEITDCFFDGSGLIENAILASAGISQNIRIENNQFHGFTEDYIYLVSCGSSRVFRNSLVEVQFSKYGIRVREKAGFTVSYNSVSGDGTLLVESGTPSTDTNIIENNSALGGSDAVLTSLENKLPGKHIWLKSLSGNNTGDGLSPATAKKTMAGATGAKSIAVFGDTIHVSDEGVPFAENWQIPDGVNVIGEAESGYPQVNGAYVSAATPILTMGLNCSIKRIWFKKGFANALDKIILFGAGSEIDDIQTGGGVFPSDLGTLALIDLNFASCGLIHNCSRLSGEGVVDNGIVASLYAEKVTIKNNRFSSFNKDVIDLTSCDQDFITENSFVDVDPSYAAIKTVSLAGHVITYNSYEAGSTLVNETGTPGTNAANLIQNNGILGTGTADEDVRYIKALLSSGAIDAKVQFVKTDGDDGDDGLSWDTARLTPQAAMTYLSGLGDGGIVFIQGGIYDENFIVPENVKVFGIDHNGAFVEIRGEYGYDNPTVILSTNAEIHNCRIGKQDGDPDFIDHIIRMDTGSKIIGCSTGGIENIFAHIIKVNGNHLTIKGNTISGSTYSLNCIHGSTSMSRIEDNDFLQVTGDMIRITGQTNTIHNNRFIQIGYGNYAVSSDTTMTNSSVTKNLWNGDTGSMYDPSKILTSLIADNSNTDLIIPQMAIDYSLIHADLVDIKVDLTTVKNTVLSIYEISKLDIQAIDYDFTTYSKAVMLFYEADRPFGATDPSFWCYVYTASGGVPSNSSEIAKRDRVKSWAIVEPV